MFHTGASGDLGVAFRHSRPPHRATITDPPLRSHTPITTNLHKIDIYLVRVYLQAAQFCRRI
jgi:hypothetical protein